MPVLYGIFLYMGVAAMSSIQVSSPRPSGNPYQSSLLAPHLPLPAPSYLFVLPLLSLGTWGGHALHGREPALYHLPHDSLRKLTGRPSHRPSTYFPILLATQFTKRVLLLLMPAKHQPDLLLLRHVPLCRVHLFTAIQLACLAVLWIVKSTSAAIIFPLMVTLGKVGL